MKETGEVADHLDCMQTLLHIEFPSAVKNAEVQYTTELPPTKNFHKKFKKIQKNQKKSGKFFFDF